MNDSFVGRVALSFDCGTATARLMGQSRPARHRVVLRGMTAPNHPGLCDLTCNRYRRTEARDLRQLSNSAIAAAGPPRRHPSDTWDREKVGIRLRRETRFSA